MSGTVMASKGAPLAHVAQLLQTAGLVLVTARGSGITHAREMDGRTAGVWPGLFAVPPAVLFRKFGVRPKLVSQGFSVADFLEGRLDVASAMTYNEYPLMLEAGRKPDDLVAFHYPDFDLNFPEDGLYVHADTLRAAPEGVRAFVRASLQGWRYAFEHPAEAVAIVMAAATRAGTGTTAAHQARMLAEIRRLALHRVGPAGLGQLDRQAFRFVHEVLRESGYLPRPVAFETFHRPLWGP